MVEWGLREELGDVGGRESWIANVRVEVRDEDGATRTGLARFGE